MSTDHREVRLGIIGCGHFGRYHAEAFAKIRGVRLAAFCNRTLEKAEALRQRFGGDVATSDPDKLFGSKDLEAVIIATQHDSHAELCRRAALVGKYVLVEKPLGMSLKECEELVEAVRGREHLITVGYKLRFFPTVQRARQLLPNPNLVIGQFVEDKWDPKMWQQDARVGGGSVLGNGCHTADMLCFLAGSRPVRVYAEGGTVVHRDHPWPDQMNALIAFENGAAGVMIQSQTTMPSRAGKYQFTCSGLNGVAIELYDRLQSGTFRVGSRTDEMTRSGDEAIYYQAKAFVDQVAKGAPSPCSLWEGVLANLLLEACFRANRLQQPQRIAWQDNRPILEG